MEGGRAGGSGGGRGGGGRGYQKKGGYRNPFQYNRPQQNPPPPLKQGQEQTQPQSQAQTQEQSPGQMQMQQTPMITQQLQAPNQSQYLQSQGLNQMIPTQFQQIQMPNQMPAFQVHPQQSMTQPMQFAYGQPFTTHQIPSFAHQFGQQLPMFPPQVHGQQQVGAQQLSSMQVVSGQQASLHQPPQNTQDQSIQEAQGQTQHLTQQNQNNQLQPGQITQVQQGVVPQTFQNLQTQVLNPVPLQPQLEQQVQTQANSQSAVAGQATMPQVSQQVQTQKNVQQNLTQAVEKTSQGAAQLGQQRQVQQPPNRQNRQKNSEAELIQPMDPKYKDLICYNCGGPGHYVGNCVQPKVCFICNMAGHHMDNCSAWGRELTMAQFVGSANGGLGFFHINIDEKASSRWLNLTNCGVIAVTHGNISVAELELCMATTWDDSWPWIVRQLEEKSFLVRFPPNKKVSDLVGLPSINLREGGDQERVTIKILPWDGDIAEVGELTEVWLQIKGIPPKWLSWKVITQISKCFGLLLDVDWNEIFRSMYKTLRVKLAVRNPMKIPPERMIVMRKKFYLLEFTVEWEGVDIDKIMGLQEKDYEEEDDYDTDNLMNDEFEDLEKERGNQQNDQGDATSANPPPAGSQTVPTHNVQQLSLQNLMCAGLVDSDDEEVGDVALIPLGTGSLAQDQSFVQQEDAYGMPETTLEEDVVVQDTDNLQGGLVVAMENPASNSQPAEVQSFMEDFPTPAEAKRKTTKKNKWGPVVAARQSTRIAQDGKSILSRAQEMALQKNLEKPATKGAVEEVTALVKALATTVPQARHTDLGQMPLAPGEQGFGNSPAGLLKKRRMTMAGPGTPKPLKLF